MLEAPFNLPCLFYLISSSGLSPWGGVCPELVDPMINKINKNFDYKLKLKLNKIIK